MALIKEGDTFITNQGCIAKVIKYNSVSDIIIEFQDEFKHQANVLAHHLRRGSVKNPYFKSVCGVGCVGVGKYKPSVNSIHTPEYSAWKSMIRRCYSKNTHERQPTYKDCYVCDEWHNFQNFAEWYVKQPYYSDNYQLDKDLLVDGNKVYSPETCILAPALLNSILTDSAAIRGEYPIGVSFNKDSGKIFACISISKKKKFLGYYDDVNHAAEAYQIAKKEHLKQTALDWKDRIDERLFHALMRKTA